MRLLLLNLPHQEQITRRYMCSYVSPESLMPPLELISCGAVAREWHGYDVMLIDSIAESKDFKATLDKVKLFNPDVILSITGFECFEEDVNLFRQFKTEIPNSVFIFFGHYATQFPKETLNFSNADYIVLGEPELVLDQLLRAISNGKELSLVNGIAFKAKDGNIIIQGQNGRIKDPNDLPIPAYDLLPNAKHYYEPLIPKPYGMIQTIRGCPYQCNYCVTSYGSKIGQLSTERIIKEIKILKEVHGVKAIRFIDDTFTINKRRIIELCSIIIEEQLDINWVCLSRTDNLDIDILKWMKKAGCIRIYFGMESGSQRMLDIYQKNTTIDKALDTFTLCKNVGIETAAFFMSGHPDETEEDFTETLNFIRKANLNYASFNPLTPYPGTSLFDTSRALIDFNIYPYRSGWKDKEIEKTFERRKQLFYTNFYLNKNYILNFLFTGKMRNLEGLKLGINMLRYLLFDKKFVISGLKGTSDK